MYLGFNYPNPEIHFTILTQLFSNWAGQTLKLIFSELVGINKPE
jgi:hypothetical protein